MLQAFRFAESGRMSHSITLERSKMKIRKTKFSQSGRSMVEILGILAIIGVLSIGGIVGYSYAMDKYRANVTINDVNLRAVDLMAQIANGSENPNLSEWSETGTAGYPISVSTDYAPSQYFIKVEQVPQTVCEIIADTFPNNEVEIWIDNEDKECKDLNTMEFGYAGFIKQGCTTSAECRGDTPMCNPDTGVCEPYPDDEACGGCPAEKPYCDSATGVCGDCKYDSDCTHLGKNYLCLHHESDTTRLPTYKSGYNTCRAYGTGSSFEAGGIEWIQIYSGNHPSYYDAERVCAHLNKRLPSVHELISNFEGYIGDGFELTPLGEAVAEKYNSNIATNTSAFSYNHLYFIVSLDTGWVSHDKSHYPHPTLCRDK